MKRRIMKLTGITAYALSTAAFAFYARMQLSAGIKISMAGMTVLILAVCPLMCVGGLILSKNMDERFRRLPMRINLCVWFAMYIVLLVNLTVLDRNSRLLMPDWNMELLKMYMSRSFNIIPFRTVTDMFVSVINGSIPLKMFVYNIFGNAAALMPTAFFLPNIFKKQRDFKTFAFTVTGIVAAIEIIQFITLSGAFDIDDFILNVSGACLMFKLLDTKKLVKFKKILEK